MRHPWDMQIWKGKKLPDHAEHAPKNVLVATRQGAGACRIRGADYDWDPFMFSNDARLLRLNRCTPDGANMPELLRAAAEVRDLLGQGPPVPCQGVMAYRKHVVSVDTMPVRSLATAAAERAQQAAIDSLDPRQADGSLVACVRLAECARIAMDAPKKFSASAVMSLVRRELADSGLGPTAARCSEALLPRFHTKSPDFAEKCRLLDSALADQVACGLGKVWIPRAPETRLSGEAGETLRELLTERKSPDFSDRVERKLLLELAGFIAHRLGCRSLRHAGAEKPTAAAAEGKFRFRPIQSIQTLKDNQVR